MIFKFFSVGKYGPPQHGAHNTPWAGSDSTHISVNRLEIANQVNAGFPQMKTEKKKKKILPVASVCYSIWNLGMDPLAMKLRVRALRKTGRNSLETAK